MWVGERVNLVMSRDQMPRLRSPKLREPLHVVLVEPEIPPNTGNIARLCAATSAHLHLVGPLGFRIDDHSLRRAGIDYWHLVEVHRHLDLAHFRHAFPEARLRLFSASSGQSYLEAGYRPGDALLFGRESVGLPDDLLAEHRESTFAIPTLGPVRSLNLANAVSIVVYEALRQLGALADTALG
jgi:tRNA (cytidine/uridine-2'-O-)-methyltransferase